MIVPFLVSAEGVSDQLHLRRLVAGIHADHVEAHGVVTGKSPRGENLRRGPCEPPLFASIDRLRGGPEARTRAQPYLDEAEGPAFECDEIQLCMAQVEVASEDAEALTA